MDANYSKCAELTEQSLLNKNQNYNMAVLAPFSVWSWRSKLLRLAPRHIVQGYIGGESLTTSVYLADSEIPLYRSRILGHLNN